MSSFCEYSHGEANLSVYGCMTHTNGGIVIQLYGGTHEHVGSVVVSTPVPSLKDAGRTSSSSTVINLPAHKEEFVARPAAERVAAAAKVPVVCVAGIHVDNATEDEIRIMSKNAEAVVDELLRRL